MAYVLSGIAKIMHVITPFIREVIIIIENVQLARIMVASRVIFETDSTILFDNE